MRGVPPSQGLRLVERRPVAHGHHGVLQGDALTRVDVHVAGGHARHTKPLGQLREQLVAAAVVAPVGALELYAEAVGAEGGEEAAGDCCSFWVLSLFDSRSHGAIAGASREAHEAVGVLLERLKADRGLPVDRVLPPAALDPSLARPAPRVPVGRGDQAAEVGVAHARLAQEREVRPVVERQLGARDRPHAERLQRLGHLHGPVQAVVVGQRKGFMPCSAAAAASSTGCEAPSRNE